MKIKANKNIIFQKDKIILQNFKKIVILCLVYFFKFIFEKLHIFINFVIFLTLF